jgi:hypothetical protein
VIEGIGEYAVQIEDVLQQSSTELSHEHATSIQDEGSFTCDRHFAEGTEPPRSDSPGAYSRPRRGLDGVPAVSLWPCLTGLQVWLYGAMQPPAHHRLPGRSRSGTEDEGIHVPQDVAQKEATIAASS